ncbi:major capsid protein [Geomicrobium sp. JCM 19055]|uniref:major capsid protein n=1 Tax=Geomicrobium sp. JCM 19055 TaxID=1460649 RepID=UPI00045ED722|nr:hypothetical protein [Geomicrobium sp. JCM 19055]GAK00913.1 hypothetical protein JCM19055_4038 [Geomicrobium sp. JCM 19055]
MAVTLQQASKLTTDTLQAGIIDTIAQESQVLANLPFMEIEGNAYVYNQEAELPEVAFREVNEAYTASEAIVEQRSEKLVILGGDVELDQFIQQTMSDYNDQHAVQVQAKAKAIANTYTKHFFKGSTASDSKAFDGIDVRVAGKDEVELDHADSVGADENHKKLDSLNRLLDAVRGGADALFMSKATRREILATLQASSHYVESGEDSFGRPVQMYGGVPILAVETNILDNQNRDIYGIKFGSYTDVSGLQNGGVQVRQLGETSAKAVSVTRIEWFTGLAVFNPYSAVRLKDFGVTP